MKVLFFIALSICSAFSAALPAGASNSTARPAYTIVGTPEYIEACNQQQSHIYMMWLGKTEKERHKGIKAVKSETQKWYNAPGNAGLTITIIHNMDDCPFRSGKKRATFTYVIF